MSVCLWYSWPERIELDCGETTTLCLRNIVIRGAVISQNKGISSVILSQTLDFTFSAFFRHITVVVDQVRPSQVFDNTSAPIRLQHLTVTVSDSHDNYDSFTDYRYQLKSYVASRGFSATAELVIQYTSACFQWYNNIIIYHIFRSNEVFT